MHQVPHNDSDDNIRQLDTLVQAVEAHRFDGKLQTTATKFACYTALEKFFGLVLVGKPRSIERLWLPRDKRVFILYSSSYLGGMVYIDEPTARLRGTASLCISAIDIDLLLSRCHGTHNAL